MRKKKQTNKFKILTPFQKRKVRGGNNGSGNNGGTPPYEPGGNKDKDKDKD